MENLLKNFHTGLIVIILNTALFSFFKEAGTWNVPQHFNAERNAVAQLVEALRYEYKPEGRGFDYRCVIGIFY